MNVPADGPPHVLIVDDDFDLASSLASTLSEAGYAVTQAASGREAKAQLVTSSPDLILLDLMMPNGNGWDVLEQLRTMGGAVLGIPVVVISAYASSVPTGARALLRKPVHREDLLGAVAGYALRAR